MPRRTLLVLTSADTMGDFPRKTGYWVEEAATPYYVFADAGYEVVLASPKGGLPPRDAESEKPEYYGSECARFDADAKVSEKLRNSLTLAKTNPEDYAAVFFAGGHGTMVDFPYDASVIRIVEAFYALGRPVASVCHGPACLISAKGPDGTPVIAGKRFTCFTNEEEALAGGTAYVPFLLQSMLEGLGGIFAGTEAFGANALADGLLITGQNPASAAQTAQLTLAALGK